MTIHTTDFCGMHHGGSAQCRPRAYSRPRKTFALPNIRAHVSRYL